MPSAFRWLFASGLAVACTAAAAAKQCPHPFTLCDGVCTDVLVDGGNCGSCGAVCSPGHACQAGACALTCAPPSTACAETCADLASDPGNCGACGSACGAGDACVAGACLPATCAGRVGGAFVTVVSCGRSVKLWGTNVAFIAQAEQLLATQQPIFAIMDLRRGGDCDREWSWHGDPATLEFAQITIEACQGCPNHVEGDLAYWLALGTFCASVERVAAVERR